MRYVALGDSISIDDYTGVPGGGAASQFARLIEATDFVNRTRDGCTTDGVLAELKGFLGQPDVVTLTAGGNDLLVGLASDGASWGDMTDQIAARYSRILYRLNSLKCPVIVNTIYDPTDGQDDLATMMGLPRDVRLGFDRVNNHIRSCAGAKIFVCDLEELFFGHGNWSQSPWIVGYIEPNLAGATAIAYRWMELFEARSWLP